jgi:hypothetical protein
MSKVIVYSKLPTSVKFFNPANSHEIILQGINTHVAEVPAGTPRANQVDAEDWEFIKTKYGDRKSYFDPINGDMFFTAKNDKEARVKLNDSKPVIDEQFMVTKSKKIGAYKEDNLG